MFKNYFKIAVRNLFRYKAFSVITIAGLTIGMACFIFIALYVQYELSYDKYHENADQIYRIVLKQPGNFYMGQDVFNTTPAMLAPALKSDFPEVSKATRLRKAVANILIQFRQNSFEETRVYYADPDFWDIFSFPFLSGNYRTALSQPYSIVLTEEMAFKYFGNTNPLGLRITVNQKDDYVVTGVVKNTPQNSHFIFDFVISYSTLISQNGIAVNWNNNNCQTYILLNNNASPMALGEKFAELIKKYKGADSHDEYFIEPLSRIHLHGQWNNEIEDNGNILYLYMFTAIGFFILLIACFNYINISTAQSARRNKEIGLRKVIGASRKQLLWQFLAESLIFSSISFFLALCLVELFLPAFRTLVHKDIHLSFISDRAMLSGLLTILISAGCLSGTYPAFQISALKPVQNLKKPGTTNTNSWFGLRNTLVIFQFVVSTILIIGTMTVYLQLQYIKNKNLGFRKDHIVILYLADKNLREKHESLMTELLSYHRISDVSASNYLPYNIQSQTGATWEGNVKNEIVPIHLLRIDSHFLDVYNISLIKGRNFLKGHLEDHRAYILNETAVKKIGWSDPIGVKFSVNRNLSDGGPVIGMIQDFHFFTLHNPVEPLALQILDPRSENDKKSARYLSIKLSSSDMPGTINFIENTWKQFTSYPFRFQFLDDSLDRMYREERRLGRLFNIFAVIAVFISCLGLYGLSSFIIKKKTKEIGIRKVLGATVLQIVNLLTKEITVCIVIANWVAWPVAWYAMNKWLQNFAYRIDLTIWPFLLSGLVALLIALPTVGWQAIQAARANPVEALRYE